MAVVTFWIAVALVGVVVTALSAYFVNVRLFRASEGGLATLRLKAFRHIHDLAMLTQNSERRGSLVSRVTSDVDTISMFVQFGGLMLIVNVAQITLATVLMVFYSPILALVVWLCFVPLFVIIRTFQGIVGRAYTKVRERVGDMLGAVSEAVVGAQAIRAYGVETRTATRIDAAIEGHRTAAIGAQARSVIAFTSGQLVSGLTTAVVLVVGTVLAVNGSLTLGELLAFLFLVNLFTMPVQQATEILNEMQNAVAGWRRVIGIIDTPADVSDPADDGVELPRGPITVQFSGVGFAYPGGEPVLHDIDLTIAPRSRVAIVGETGSGKSTLAKLLTRLMDPTSGRVLLDGTELRRIRFSSLRSRVVLVPQEGFLFDGTLLDNVRFGRPDATEEQVRATQTDLGLDGWVGTLPLGLATDVGQRGESLSAGERQLVALARAYLADPDLLVLDEATSAVDPHTEVRLQRALDSLTRGRTSIAIAHRLSTAENADEVIVVDAGRIVERGHHSELVALGGVYTRLHASWVAQQQAL
jgi:putative ABC transport system ATP-binding protein